MLRRNEVKRSAMLAAVVLLADANGAALAQSSVTVYGLLDVGLVRESGGSAGAATKVGSGVANGSRLGFKGDEALGAGWSALFLLEAGIQLDDGTSSQGGVVFGRQSYVGLRGPAGTITVGRQYTPQFDTLVLADPFSSGQVADAKNLMPSTGDATTRMTNSIKYASANHGGISGELAYAPGETAGDAGRGRQFGGALAYARGALKLRLGYHYRNTDTPASRHGGPATRCWRPPTTSAGSRRISATASTRASAARCRAIRTTPTAMRRHQAARPTVPTCCWD